MNRERDQSKNERSDMRDDEESDRSVSVRVVLTRGDRNELVKSIPHQPRRSNNHEKEEKVSHSPSIEITWRIQWRRRSVKVDRGIVDVKTTSNVDR